MNRHLVAALFGLAGLLALPLTAACGAEPTPSMPREPYGIGLEGFAYPYPVNMLPLVNDGDRCGWPIWMWPRRSPTAVLCCCCTAAISRRRYWAPVIKDAE